MTCAISLFDYEIFNAVSYFPTEYIVYDSFIGDSRHGWNSSRNGIAKYFKIPFRPQVLMLLAQLVVTRIFHELNE